MTTRDPFSPQLFCAYMILHMFQVSIRIEQIAKQCNIRQVMMRVLYWWQVCHTISWVNHVFSWCSLSLYILLRRRTDCIEGNIRLITCWSGGIDRIKSRNSLVSLFVILLWHLNNNYNILSKLKCWPYILHAPPVNHFNPLAVSWVIIFL